MGFHANQSILTGLLTTLTWIVEIFAVIPFLHSTILMQIALVLFLLNITLLFATAFTEPGIIPRISSHQTAARLENLKLLYMMDKNPAKYNFCSCCQIIRPPRTRHCRYCDNCVQQFDHHCRKLIMHAYI